MKRLSVMATLICVAATLFTTTLRSAETGSDPKAQVAKLQSEIETLKAEIEALKKENQSLRRIVAAGQQQQQTTTAPAPVKQPASFIPDTPKAQQKATGYWMTTSSHKRHNSSCRYYMNSNGRACGPTDGIPCKICGG